MDVVSAKRTWLCFWEKKEALKSGEALLFLLNYPPGAWRSAPGHAWAIGMTPGNLFLHVI